MHERDALHIALACMDVDVYCNIGTGTGTDTDTGSGIGVSGGFRVSSEVVGHLCVL